MKAFERFKIIVGLNCTIRYDNDTICTTTND
jgi:hypothetical protein